MRFLLVLHFFFWMFVIIFTENINTEGKAQCHAIGENNKKSGELDKVKKS